MQEPWRIAERAERAAMEDLFAAPHPTVRARLGLEARRFGGVLAMRAPSAETPLFHRALGFGVDEPVTRAQLDETLEMLRGARAYLAVAQPAHTEALDAALQARGLAVRSRWVRMVRPPDPPAVAPSAGLEIAELTEAHGTAFARVACAAYRLPDRLEPWFAALVGRPGWTILGAFEGEALVGTGGLWTGFAGGVKTAWFGFGCTLPSARRRGSQRAILAERIRIAVERNAKLLVAETGEPVPPGDHPSFRNMSRLGFELAYARPNWCAEARP